LSGDADELQRAVFHGEVTSEALISYVEVIEEEAVESRQIFIGQHFIYNQWRMAPAILPQAALMQWREERTRNGSAVDSTMASEFPNLPRHVVVAGDFSAHVLTADEL